MGQLAPLLPSTRLWAQGTPPDNRERQARTPARSATRKPRLREVKSPAQAHTAGPWRSWHLNLGLHLLWAWTPNPCPSFLPFHSISAQTSRPSGGSRRVPPRGSSVACHLHPLLGYRGAGGEGGRAAAAPSP